jgi:O-antigen ligase
VRTLRAYGLTDHPNILGGCLAVGLLLLLVWHLKSGAQWKAISAGLIALGGIGLFLSFSRSAWLGLAAGLGLVAAWVIRRRDGERLAQLMALACACLLLLAPFAWQNAGALGVRLGQNGSFSAATPENQSINERILLARQAIDLFAANPLTGVGVGTFPQVMRRVNPDYAFSPQPPHQVALDLAAETGVLGGICYLALEVLPWAMLFVARRRLRFSWELAGLTAALLALSVISLLDYYPWMFNPGQLWQWLLWGLWAGFFNAATRGDPLNTGGLIHA